MHSVCPLDTEAADNDDNTEAAPKEPAVTAKILRYANRLIRRYDRNSDGRLQEAEWRVMHGQPRLLDLDGDAVITLQEFARRVADYGHRRKIRLIPKNLEDLVPSPPLLQPMTSAASEGSPKQPLPAEKPAASSTTPSVTETPAAKGDFRRGQRFYVAPRHRVQGLPGWFIARDANGDQQISMSEFAPKATESDIKEFAAHDTNGDGIITAKECIRKTSSPPPQPSPSTSVRKIGL